MMSKLIVFIVTVAVMSLIFGIDVLWDKRGRAREEKELLESGYLDTEGAQNEH